MSYQRRRSRLNTRGFALAAVLWLLAGLSIVITMISDISQTSAERVALIQKRTDFLISVTSAKSQAQHWLSSASSGLSDFSKGSDSIRVDGSIYKFDEDSMIRLQDEGGLINLSSIDRNLINNFLIQCGVPMQRVPYLIDALEDYIDSDNLQRINGAEQAIYAEYGNPPPRNAPLVTVQEIWRIHGWGEFRINMEQNGCSELLTIYGETTMTGASLNLATAPEKVLLAAGLDKEQIGDITNARNDPERLSERTALNNQLAGRNTGMFSGLTGKHVQRTVRVTHLSAKGPWQFSYILFLDSSNDDRPWQVLHPELKSMNSLPNKKHLLVWPHINTDYPINEKTNLLF